MKKSLFLLAAVLLLVSCRPKPDLPSSGPALNLLFIGNSYTGANDLPGMLVQLARSGGHPVTVESVLVGGRTLAEHANTRSTMDKIASKKWDYVILQDQSFMPSVEAQRQNELYPAVRYLDHAIRQAGAKTLLYMTWGREKGMPDMGFKDFEAMQDQLTYAYQTIAKEVGCQVAPVGEAWRTALKHDPGSKLWMEDGSHPTVLGTYLAACTFYAVIYQQSPEGLGFTAGLSNGDAKAMQAVSAEVVLTSKSTP